MVLCKSKDDVIEEGLNVWSDGGDNPTADIVLVHGLGSHPYWAWHYSHSTSSLQVHKRGNIAAFDSVIALVHPSGNSSGSSPPDARWNADDYLGHPAANSPSQRQRFGNFGFFWPRDVLPQSFPRARICTLGYKSQWTSRKYETTFQECGKSLLNTLANDRRTNQSRRRPLIFIAHSFGGLVVQSALIDAQLDESFGHISDSLAGLIFLGCPFGGSTVAAIADNWTSVVGNRQQILSCLEPGSAALFTLQDRFQNCCRQIPTVCFYERLKSLRGSVYIVSDTAARIAGTRAVGMHTDHRGLSKFSSETDPSYLSLESELRPMYTTTSDGKKKSKTANRRLRRRSDVGRWMGSVANTFQQVRARSRSRPSRLYSDRTGTATFDNELPPQMEDQIPRLDDPRSSSSIVAPNSMPESPYASIRPRFPYAVRSSRVRLEHIPQRQGERDRHTPKHPTPPPLATWHVDSHAVEEESMRGQHPGAQPDPQSDQKGPRNLPEDLQLSLAVLKSQQDKLADHDHRNSSSPVADSGSDHERPAVLTTSSNGPAPRLANLNEFHAQDAPFNRDSSTVSGRITEIIDSYNHVSPGPFPEIASDGIIHLLSNEKAILATLQPTDRSSLLCSQKVVLTGPFGHGKSRHARAFADSIQIQLPDAKVAWIDCSERMVEHCSDAADQFGLPRPDNTTNIWSWLCELQLELSICTSQPWLLILDGVEAVDDLSVFHKYCNIACHSSGSILMTTRRRDLANIFLAGNGLKVDVGPLDGSYAADILGNTSDCPRSHQFDFLAAKLEYIPSAIANGEYFLRMTKILVDDYSDCLDILLDPLHWEENGQASRAAQATFHKLVFPLTSPCTHTDSKAATLVSVLQNIANPSWYTVFARLSRDEPVALEVLSALSVLGRPDIPVWMLSQSRDATTSAAAQVLTNHSLLGSVSVTGTQSTSVLMLTALRVWLIGQAKVATAYEYALRLVAVSYPSTLESAYLTRCSALDPFAEDVLRYANSLGPALEALGRGYAVALAEQRKLHQSSLGPDIWTRHVTDDVPLAELPVNFTH